nr:hypothetical protein [uncultured Flavobacterium sp.]
MVEKQQNTALLTVGNSALKNADWTEYANYCLCREKGLRKESFTHLDKFLKSAENWVIERKIEFVKFLFPFFETVEYADYGPFPQPLSSKLVKPALIEWCETEKNDEKPFRWYGKYYRSEEHLFKALEINPADDLARQTILNWWTEYLYQSVHHLPEGYIGEPLEDIKLGERIKEQIQLLTTPQLKEYWMKELDEYLELVRNYIDWKTSEESDFEKWGEENKKETTYGVMRTYNYEKR